MWWISCAKYQSIRERKRFLNFVPTFLLYGGLYQMMFLYKSVPLLMWCAFECIFVGEVRIVRSIIKGRLWVMVVAWVTSEPMEHMLLPVFR